MKSSIRKFAFLFTLLSATATFTGCDDDDKTPMEEETAESITKVTLTFKGDGTPDVTATATDADGDGLNFVFSPTTLTLVAGKDYDLEISLLNELESPAEDITEEIKEEADEHQLFVTVTNSVITATVSDTENDYVGDGCTGCANSTAPVGLTYDITTNADATTTGKMTVLLKHQPGDQKTGQSSSGETDVELTFDVALN